MPAAFPVWQIAQKFPVNPTPSRFRPLRPSVHHAPAIASEVAVLEGPLKRAVDLGNSYGIVLKLIVTLENPSNLIKQHPPPMALILCLQSNKAAAAMCVSSLAIFKQVDDGYVAARIRGIADCLGR